MVVEVIEVGVCLEGCGRDCCGMSICGGGGGSGDTPEDDSDDEFDRDADLSGEACTLGSLWDAQ